MVCEIPELLLVLSMMVAKREYVRHLVKLPAEVLTGDDTISGITVWMSPKGLFIRSQRSFLVGTPVEIVLHLSGEIFCRLKGVVKYEKSFVEFRRQNGMGIEFTEVDRKYMEFIKSVA